MNHSFKLLVSAAALTFSLGAGAQLSSNPDKFLGNITTDYNVDYGKEPFYTLWNQITPENESKWGSVEGGARGSFNWSDCDRIYNYAKQHNFPMKFHCLVWGAQYPSWMDRLSESEQLKAIEEWMDAASKRYPDLQMIDVVNEAVAGHQPAPYRGALGGDGKTGYDWIIKAFEMAHERWPDAILIYNDYNTFQWNTDQFIDLVRTVRDAGAPIDAYGCQSHDLTDCNITTFKNSMNKLQRELKMPMYSSEYDIGTSDDALQEQRYKEQIPVMWEADYCAGITLWGYIYGKTWTTDGNSGLYKNGKERPAMTWLKEYMASNAAKQAKSPFPGMKKEVSVYVRPAALKVAKGDVLPVKVRTHITAKDKVIEKVDLYVNNVLDTTMTEAPYLAEYQVPKNSTTGWKTLKAVVTTTDGSTYTRESRFNVLGSTVVRKPYLDEVPQLPGTIETKNYDTGAAGVSYYNASRNNVATKDGQWMEYTVDVQEESIYSFDVEVASAKDGGSFYLAEYGMDNLDYLTDFTNVPNTGSTTDFKTMHGVMKMPLTAGRHVLCLNITKGGFYIKSLTFKRYEQDSKISVVVQTPKPSSIVVGETSTITVTASSSTSTIDNVKVYANNLLIGTLTEAPYTLEFQPTAKGSYSIIAIATDAEGKEKQATAKTLKVNGKREPYKGVITIPGIIQAENFDKGGEGLSFHDSDTENQGDANYRTDNEGLDLVKGNNGTAIGYTANNEWTEYTVNVTEPGEYQYVATVSNGSSSTGGFTISLVKGTSQTQLAKVSFGGTGGWDTYKTFTGKLTKNLAEGEQILRFTINPGNCNIDKVELKCTLNTGIEYVEHSTTNDAQRSSFNLQGQKVGGNYRGIVIKNGRKVIKR